MNNDDASLMLLDAVTKQLDSKHPHTRILFIDFSSAFTTVNNVFLHRLSDLQVHPHTDFMDNELFRRQITACF